MKKKKNLVMKISVIVVITIFLLTVFIWFISVLIPANSSQNQDEIQMEINNIVEQDTNRAKTPNIFESLDIESTEVKTWNSTNITWNILDIITWDSNQ